MGILKKSENTRGLSITCPKCRADVIFTELRDDMPVRCGKCMCPMVTRSDLLLIINACKKVKTPYQAVCAVSILRKLAEFMPDAAAALGMLPALVTATLPVEEHDRWNMLNNAYTAGNDDARAGLELMQKSSPMLYGSGYCKRCGAKKYYGMNGGSKTVCRYCRKADEGEM